ncbi:unnamed protein product, partial [Rotaria sp. Silwood1]
RTSSYASCYSAVATIMPISSITRHGSIESLLHGHSKSNLANISIIGHLEKRPNLLECHLILLR